MSSPAPSAAYREAAGWITPADLSTYLASTPPWQLEARQDDVREIWTLPGPYGRLQARIMLPLATDYADFSDRFSDAIAAVGHIYDCLQIDEGSRPASPCKPRSTGAAAQACRVRRLALG